METVAKLLSREWLDWPFFEPHEVQRIGATRHPFCHGASRSDRPNRLPDRQITASSQIPVQPSRQK
jgi:hypothetical protein